MGEMSDRKTISKELDCARHVSKQSTYQQCRKRRASWDLNRKLEVPTLLARVVTYSYVDVEKEADTMKRCLLEVERTLIWCNIPMFGWHRAYQWAALWTVKWRIIATKGRSWMKLEIWIDFCHPSIGRSFTELVLGNAMTAHKEHNISKSRYRRCRVPKIQMFNIWPFVLAAILTMTTASVPHRGREKSCQ